MKTTLREALASFRHIDVIATPRNLRVDLAAIKTKGKLGRAELKFRLVYGEETTGPHLLRTSCVVDLGQEITINDGHAKVEIIGYGTGEGIDGVFTIPATTFRFSHPVDAPSTPSTGRDRFVLRNLKTELSEAVRALEELERINGTNECDDEDRLILMKTIASQTQQAAGNAKYLQGYYDAKLEK